MCNYGELSKAQRKLLDYLGETAVSIETALWVDGKSRQTAANLQARGLVEVESVYSWRTRVWLTPNGCRMLKNVRYQRSTSRYSRHRRPGV